MDLGRTEVKIERIMHAVDVIFARKGLSNISFGQVQKYALYGLVGINSFTLSSTLLLSAIN